MFCWIFDLVQICVWLEEQVCVEGFNVFGICVFDVNLYLFECLVEFLVKEWYGQMEWMVQWIVWWVVFDVLWFEVWLVIMLVEFYIFDYDLLVVLDYFDWGGVSVYVQGKDYYDLVKKWLKWLGGWLVGQIGVEIKVFVDIVLVMEKLLVMVVGLGWQGKYINLLLCELGSWFFLGLIFIMLDLFKDCFECEYCGFCCVCLDVCLMNVFFVFF